MPKILLAVIVLGFFLIPWQKVQAHLAGQPPFFKVNGLYSNLYPVPSTSLENFRLPQDLAPANYLVSQSIDFELVVSLLPVPPEIVTKTAFTWDFGDGTLAKGLKNSHTYKNPGSYFVTINAQYVDDPKPQLLESALLNVLPNVNYKLPKSVISVSGWQSKDPLTDILNLKFGQAFDFDASSSRSGTDKIVSYYWDFGDQQSSYGLTINHIYSQDLSQVFPVLRVKNESGFVSDSFVEIENSTLTGSTGPSNISPPPQNTGVSYQIKSPQSFPVKQVAIFCGILLFTLGLVSRFLKKKM